MYTKKALLKRFAWRVILYKSDIRSTLDYNAENAEKEGFEVMRRDVIEKNVENFPDG